MPQSLPARACWWRGGAPADLVEQNPKGVNVAGRGQPPLVDHLGRHEGGGPHLNRVSPRSAAPARPPPQGAVTVSQSQAFWNPPQSSEGSRSAAK